MNRKHSPISAQVAIIAVIFLITGCAIKPETVTSPSVKIDYAIQDNKETYTVHFSGGIRNENNSVAFLDMKGNIRIMDAEKKLVDTFPFIIPAILPFDTGILDFQVTRSESEIAPLLDLLKISREQLVSDGSSSGNYIDEEDIALSDLQYEKKNIITLLQEKK